MFKTNPPQPSFPERREHFSATLKSQYFNLAEMNSSLTCKGGWEGFLDSTTTRTVYYLQTDYQGFPCGSLQ
jgi:hypothetical protein